LLERALLVMTRSLLITLFSSSLVIAGCSSTPPATSTPTAGSASGGSSSPSSSSHGGEEIELVESFPIETTLDHKDVRDASDVWLEMIGRAKKTIDWSEFYASDAEPPWDKDGRTKLGDVLVAIEGATKRGVKMRFIADKVFAPKYPATLDRLRTAGVEVRIIDCAPRYGGVQHAKYMIVDGEEAFVGSQNFDWRALSHIQEIGTRLRSPVMAGALADIFDTDWALAEPGTPNDTRVKKHPSAPDVKAATGETVSLYADPRGWLPDESHWDLTRLLALLDGAKKSIDLQVLIYSVVNRDKSAFTTLDEAIRRAAARGVKVRMLISHWGANAGSHNRKSIDALIGVPNVEIRILTIPPYSKGEIPFARVAHAKYMLVDGGEKAWIGTSNWEGDYFLKTRNIAVVTEGGALGKRLDRIFEDGWTSTYAAPLASTAAAHQDGGMKSTQ
jgi:phosphatidylserine/phosphatidylglycerophosphate/cardiolipin synthase-like enzyme